jgi:hypothetical protein
MPDTVTDKVDGGYLPTYLRIAAELGPTACVLELGVYEGASLRLWQALFPLGVIAGVDCNPAATWPEGTRRVCMRQEDPQLPVALRRAGLIAFALIVDDASHKGELTAAAFARLWPLLAPGGYYVIEDWMIGLRGFCDHPMYDPGMAGVVTGITERLTSQDAEVDEITYRYGLCVIHKRRDEREVKTHG